MSIIGDDLIFLKPSAQASVVSSKQMKPDASLISAPSDVAGTPQKKWKYESSNSLTLSVEGGAAESFETGTTNEGTSEARFLLQHREPSFHIPDHDWGDKARSVPSCISQGGSLGPSFGSRRINTSTTPIASPDHETTALSGVTTQSLLMPSRSGGLFQAMLEADEKEAALNFDEGDLTDDDDDEAFILAAPGVLVEEREAQNRESSRARQRPRRGYEEPDQTRRSMTSLYSSDQASNTSLLGLDILQQGSYSSSCSRRAVPGFNLASKSGSSAKPPESAFLPSAGCFFPML
jgi:hypothetical protein